MAAVCAGLALPAMASAETTLVKVKVPDQAAVDKLIGLGLDATFLHADNLTVEVMLHSAEDEARLDRLGYAYDVVHEDLGAFDAQQRSAESAKQRKAAASEAFESTLPTGRQEYRTMASTIAEMQQLAAAHPTKVKLVELKEKTLLGRTVYALEISHDVHTESGKPVFFLSGVHHAREWPTVEFTMEFVHDLLANDGTDARITSLLDRGKLIAVPMMNMDGYDVSRSNATNGLQQKRKNCREAFGVIPTMEQCYASTSTNRGVDNNRNYPAFWGGPGSSASLTASNHRGESPLSEPENRSMIDLWTKHQITVSVNNHTPDRRLLRAPSSSNEPIPADVEVYDELENLLGADVNWPSGPWTEVYYEASGTAEQTAYYGAGTLAFTPEAAPGYSGNNTFHPPYQAVIDNYTGIGQYPGQSMRAMYLTAFTAAVDPTKHSVIKGTAPAGATLTATKDFPLDSSLLGGAPIPTQMHYETKMTVPSSGKFEWHVNPSLRPSQYGSVHLNEAWTIKCTAADGTLLETKAVTIARGQVADLSLCTQGTVGGTVPATLALTLGAPATFEPFIPGVAKTYEASSTANVISTAGDATLSVSEPGYLMNGSFALAQPLQVTFSKSTWTAPVSNDPVTIGFKQPIGATDPLRTGVYSKTLTFTLSTTNP
jgi:murein tripeptide amidase MpaA